MRLCSWNVNGFRSVLTKGFYDALERLQPDILCLQETRVHTSQLSEEARHIEGYHSFWSTPERKGYSGVAVFSKQQPRDVSDLIGKTVYDSEGRVLRLEYDKTVLFNVYFPNGKRDEDRLQYKLQFYEYFTELLDQELLKNERIIICGDFNTAHQPIDLARPKENEKVSGFLPEERVLLDALEERGWVDTFRFMHPEKVQYSWFSFRSAARKRNVGWRIDYFFVSEALNGKVKSATIDNDVFGSDHCPVLLELDLKKL